MEKRKEVFQMLSTLVIKDNTIIYLGTYIGKTDAASTLNLNKAINKMCKTTQKWRNRTLSLTARISVFKTMIFSQIVHVINTMHITTKTVDFLQKFANDFLW